VIEQFVQDHLGLTIAILCLASGFAGAALTAGIQAYRTNKAWDLADNQRLYDEYLKNPIRVDDEEDDWTEYQQTVRPQRQYEPVRQVSLAVTEIRPVRNYDVYLDAIPVSPAPTSYLGTEGYVGRHNRDGRTEAQVRALNTSTGTFKVVPIDIRGYRAPAPGYTWLDESWRKEGRLPEVHELVSA